MDRIHRVMVVLGAAALVAGGAAAQQPSSGDESVHGSPRREAAAPIPGPTGVSLFPGDDLFRPLIADPKESTFFASLLGGSSPSRGSRTGSVGIGATVAIVRWAGPGPHDGLEFGLGGGVFAQFDLTRKSHDLINADYVIGLPIALRRGPYAVRFRVYHQSSHLGDEFVENRVTDRLNLSFEALELLVSRDFGPVRGYAGGEYRFNRNPQDSLEHGVLHTGVEYRYPSPLVRMGGWGALRPVIALDAQSFEYRDWRLGWSGRAGVELGPLSGAGRSGRTVRFMFELYDGPNPYGQFFAEGVTSVGFGAHFTY